MLTLPTLCALCRSWARDPICPDCVARFARPRLRCPRCALPLSGPGGGAFEPALPCPACQAHPPPFDAAVAAVDYAAPWSGLITRFKFEGRVDLAAALAARLTAALRARRDALAAQAPADVGLVLPVPTSADRLRERGYNQSWELARRVARALQLPSDAALLLRTGAHTASQAGSQVGTDRAQRRLNVRHAFLVEPLRQAQIKGQRVAIVDDVMTTGATAWELAATLKQAGAAWVEIWCVARTP